MRFISCDWGTSSLRLRLVASPPPRVEAEVASDDGAARIQAAVVGTVTGPSRAALAAARARRFEGIFLERLAELGRLASASISGLPVVISGMASSSIGWRELAYGTLPLELDGAGLPLERLGTIGSGRHPSLLVSGVRTELDILRGEEVEALGLLNSEAHRELAKGVLLILPGTHSKHIRVTEGRITGFDTFMTGELYEVMARHSVLASSVDAGALSGASWTTAPDLSEAFRRGVSEGGRLQPLSASLFSVRARDVLARESPGWCAAYLSGQLIGAELRSAAQSAGSTPVLVAARAPLFSPYRLASSVLDLGERVVFAAPPAVELAVIRGQELVLERAQRV